MHPPPRQPAIQRRVERLMPGRKPLILTGTAPPSRSPRHTASPGQDDPPTRAYLFLLCSNCACSWRESSSRKYQGNRENGGAGGIRTLDTVLPYTHFPGERLRPLGHRSACAGRAAHVEGESAIGQACRAAAHAPMPRADDAALRPPPSADEIEAIARARAGRACPSRSPPSARCRPAGRGFRRRRDCSTRWASRIRSTSPASMKAFRSAERSVEQSGTLPDRIRLFRRADPRRMGRRRASTLEHLVATS